MLEFIDRRAVEQHTRSKHSDTNNRHVFMNSKRNIILVWFTHLYGCEITYSLLTDQSHAYVSTLIYHKTENQHIFASVFYRRLDHILLQIN